MGDLKEKTQDFLQDRLAVTSLKFPTLSTTPMGKIGGKGNLIGEGYLIGVL